MPLQLNEAIAAIPIYPAASTYDFGGTLAKLASNESPFAPHPAVAEAIAIAAQNANRYPDPTGSLLRQKIAERHGMPVERVVLGNGSCEILLAAAQVMLEPGAEIVYAWPTFSMYPHLAAMTGAAAITVPLTADHRHDLSAMAAAVTERTRMLVVCNPNNPTATFIDQDEISALIDSLPDDVCVIVDEAYIEFSGSADPDRLLPLVTERDNVVVTRTFAKVFGLAGLRIGYGFGSPLFRQTVDLVRQPFSVNLIAQAAASEALNHPDDIVQRVESTLAERNWIETEMREAGFKTAETATNFSWIDLGGRNEEEVVKALARDGIIVRAGKALGAEGFIRASYGTHEENQRFASAIAALTTQVAG